MISHCGAGFTTPISGATDPYFANVAALLHMDGSNGGTTFTDVKGHTWTPTSMTTSTTQAKFGSASMLSGGSGAQLVSTHASYAPGTGDLCYECWVYLTDVTSTQVLFLTPNYAGAGFEFYLASNTLTIYGGGTSIGSTASGMLSTNTWTHIALTRTSGVWKVFVGGVIKLTVTNSLNITDTQLYLSYAGFGLSGYMDDFRLTVGQGRYTSDFSPPTTAFPDS